MDLKGVLRRKLDEKLEERRVHKEAYQEEKTRQAPIVRSGRLEDIRQKAREQAVADLRGGSSLKTKFAKVREGVKGFKSEYNEMFGGLARNVGATGLRKEDLFSFPKRNKKNRWFD